MYAACLPMQRVVNRSRRVQVEVVDPRIYRHSPAHQSPTPVSTVPFRQYDFSTCVLILPNSHIVYDGNLLGSQVVARNDAGHKVRFLNSVAVPVHQKNLRPCCATFQPIPRITRTWKTATIFDVYMVVSLCQRDPSVTRSIRFGQHWSRYFAMDERQPGLTMHVGKRVSIYALVCHSHSRFRGQMTAWVLRISLPCQGLSWRLLCSQLVHGLL